MIRQAVTTLVCLGFAHAAHAQYTFDLPALFGTGTITAGATIQDITIDSGITVDLTVSGFNGSSTVNVDGTTGGLGVLGGLNNRIDTGESLILTFSDLTGAGPGYLLYFTDYRFGIAPGGGATLQAGEVATLETSNSVLIDGSNTTVTGTISGLNPIDATGAGQTLTLTATSGDFIVRELTAVPEPSTYAALAGALALGLVIARRRK